ncbi:hypothetical protein CW304_00270 [Bacillus sp. UFRGS-B20]|nr:hypothetical protein CW304_00270 [Bacillus sp. UFRGS-B20]
MQRRKSLSGYCKEVANVQRVKCKQWNTTAGAMEEFDARMKQYSPTTHPSVNELSAQSGIRCREWYKINKHDSKMDTIQTSVIAVCKTSRTMKEQSEEIG